MAVQERKNTFGNWSKYRKVRVKKAATPAPNPDPTPDPTPNPYVVYVPRTGSKYHSISNCGNMRNPNSMSESEAISLGYTRCSKCW